MNKKWLWLLEVMGCLLGAFSILAGVYLISKVVHYEFFGIVLVVLGFLLLVVAVED